jgi:hypothetical protein
MPHTESTFQSKAESDSIKLAELNGIIDILSSALQSLDKGGHSMASIHLNEAIEALRLDAARIIGEVEF